MYVVADLRCPECEAPLIALDEPVRAARVVAVLGPAPEPPGEAPSPAAAVWSGPRDPPQLRAALTLGLAVAFALGAIAPRIGAAGRAEPRGRVALDRGIAIELVHIRRSLREIRADFRLREGLAGAVKQVSVEVVTHLDEVVPLRPPTAVRGDGFSITADVPAGIRRIKSLRITGLDVDVGARPAWTVDISRIWPVPAGEQRLLSVGQSRPVGKRVIFLEGLRATSGGIRAAFDTSGLNAGDLQYTFGGYELRWRSPAGSAATIESRVRGSISALAVDFDEIPDSARLVTIRLTDGVRFVAGSWAWALPIRLEGVQPGAQPSIIPTCHGIGPSRVCGLTSL